MGKKKKNFTSNIQPAAVPDKIVKKKYCRTAYLRRIIYRWIIARDLLRHYYHVGNLYPYDFFYYYFLRRHTPDVINRPTAVYRKQINICIYIYILRFEN